MEIIVPDEIKKSPRLLATVDRVGKMLEVEAPDSGKSIRAEWGVFRDEAGRAGLDLSIADASGSATKRFPPDKLSDDDFLEGRVIRLWGDWLQESSRWLGARLMKSIQALEED